MAHLRALLCTLARGLRVGRGGGVGRIAAWARVRGRTHNYSLVYLHYRSLDGIWERPAGRGTHVHHHVALWRGHLSTKKTTTKRGSKKQSGMHKTCVGNSLCKSKHLLSVMSGERADCRRGTGTRRLPTGAGRTGPVQRYIKKLMWLYASKIIK